MSGEVAFPPSGRVRIHDYLSIRLDVEFGIIWTNPSVDLGYGMFFPKTLIHPQKLSLSPIFTHNFPSLLRYSHTGSPHYVVV